MLRGELLAMDGQSIRFRANQEDQRFPRGVVESIVWLHADHLAKRNKKDDDANAKVKPVKKAKNKTDEQESGQQQVQIL